MFDLPNVAVIGFLWILGAFVYGLWFGATEKLVPDRRVLSGEPDEFRREILWRPGYYILRPGR